MNNYRPHVSYNNPTILIPLRLDELLRSDNSKKSHFISLGEDFVRLSSYQRFRELLSFGGGTLIKTVVFDLSTFLKREQNNTDSHTYAEFADFLTSNDKMFEREGGMTPSRRSIGLKNWVFMIIGYLLHSYSEKEAEKCLDQLIKIYLNSRNDNLFTASNHTTKDLTDARDKFMLDTFNQYVKKVPIRYKLLFGRNPYRHVSFHEGLDYKKVSLPELPRLRNRELLVKALMHKEFYRILLDPRHEFAQTMVAAGYDLNHKEYSIVRKQVSFLDGLGDLFLAHETSKVIYELYSDGLPLNNGSYRLLRTMLATNTFMTKLAIAYNLHVGLDDPIINERVANEWIPCIMFGKEMEKSNRVYEEEFLGDFFEAYVAALLIEQPDVAKSFIKDIYSRLLEVITETLPPELSYHNWSTNVLGRSIYPKSERVLI
ncbi:uncharacterized protein SPAPADRAFT_140011 [Spathaspora passalidarum NRRL Y-27907]|uniref:RNase III domain-containing protein n=1 Tax=Spathaspora passalidarum (strain NRRL Y-27907 / 11-Y1) TaxID=619300 RepID=G3AQE6_SPAPN|nr:uncharacterized protein SPAPADRAFT_140011 [Spathaspora passalidarum NRRL Y-27907]EGW31493.1 hypothetical protein SPAPADRAFT_140011 [Spathaspora passalidarum NRRL Y-27907]